MLGVLIGAVIGGTVVWFWRDRLAEKLDEKTRTLRVRAADTLETMERQADELLDKAKPRIHSTLRAGKEAIRPSESAPPPGAASGDSGLHRAI
jgi:gas vesicle protein